MHFNKDGFGELFDEDDDGGSPADMEQVMNHIDHLIADHNMPISDVLESLLNLLKPGATDMSHDVIQHFRVAMAVQGHIDAANHVKALWFTRFPWGLGFHFGFEEGFNVNGMPSEHKRAIVRSLAAILTSGGITATVTDDDLLHVKNPTEGDQDIEVVLTKFRQELDAELGPDAPQEGLPRDGPELREWLKRWMPEE